MKKILISIILIAQVPLVYALESIPAKWQHELSSTYLTDYKKDEHLVISSIYKGTHGVDAVEKYGLEVKVGEWEVPYKKEYESKKGKYKEILTVTLYEMDDPKEIKVKFKHVVYENEKIKLMFSGITILVRVNHK
ncbi:hypothetical protein ACFLR5_02225 [Elusimicrobiota bacterium]